MLVVLCELWVWGCQRRARFGNLFAGAGFGKLALSTTTAGNLLGV
jgi:hypothetical protein